MNELMRLDHVAIAVNDTARALQYFEGHLGLRVQSSEVPSGLPLRLTYLDCGNALIQLVEPLEPGTAIGDSLERSGEGLHHICFEVRDVSRTAAGLAGTDAGEVQLIRGQGRVSAFVPGSTHHGTRVECTQLDVHEGSR